MTATIQAPEYLIVEKLSMEPIRTWYGLKWAVVSRTFIKKQFGQLVQDKTIPPEILTLPAFDYTKAGHARCKEQLKELRKRFEKQPAESEA